MQLRLRGIVLFVLLAACGLVSASAQPAIQPTVDITRRPALGAF